MSEIAEQEEVKQGIWQDVHEEKLWMNLLEEIIKNEPLGNQRLVFYWFNPDSDSPSYTDIRNR